MKKNLAERQGKMKQRVEQEAAAGPKLIRTIPPPVYLPVDYSTAVEYLSAEVQLLAFWPRAAGVYLLKENGEYYIGQSLDVPARYASHRLQPGCCKFKDPRCVLLASVPFFEEKSWSENNRTRLIAEARFIAAAITLSIPLTNTLSEGKMERLGQMFADLSEEQKRLESALKILC